MTSIRAISTFIVLLASAPASAAAPVGDLVVRTEDQLLRVDSATGTRTLLSGRNLVEDLALAPSGALFALVRSDPGVVAIDPVSGQRRTISSSQRGSGALFAGPIALDVAPDGDLVVLDEKCRVHRVDPETGDRSLVSGAERGAGPKIDHCQALAVGADGILYVAEGSYEDRVLAIDPETGNRFVLSGDGVDGGPDPVGAGPTFNTIRNMTADADGIWVLDLEIETIVESSDDWYYVALSRVIHVDPATGDRRIVSDTDQELNPPALNTFADVARPAPGVLLLFDDHIVVLVDEATGARTAIDVPFRVPAAIVGNADAVYVAWTGWNTLGGIARVEIPSGDSNEIADDRVGGGPPFTVASYPDPLARALAVDSRGYLLATASETLFRVHPITGHRTILSDPTRGTGPSLGIRPTSIAVLPDGRIFVAASLLPGQAVIQVDPASGNRTVVSGEGVGGGPELPHHGCRSLAAEPEGTLLCVASSLPQQRQIVFRIDPATGDRSEVASNPYFGAFSIGELIALGNDQAYFTDPVGKAWYRLDLATGVPTLISKLGVGSGPTPKGPSGITLRPNGAIVSGDNGSGWALLRIDPATGNRALVSGRHSTQPIEIGEGAWGPVSDVVFTPEPSPSLLGLVAAGLLFARARRR